MLNVNINTICFIYIWIRIYCSPVIDVCINNVYNCDRKVYRFSIPIKLHILYIRIHIPHLCVSRSVKLQNLYLFVCHQFLWMHNTNLTNLSHVAYCTIFLHGIITVVRLYNAIACRSINNFSFIERMTICAFVTAEKLF